MRRWSWWRYQVVWWGFDDRIWAFDHMGAVVSDDSMFLWLLHIGPLEIRRWL